MDEIHAHVLGEPKPLKSKNMAYGLARVKNLSSGDIKSTETHNARKYEELGLPVPEHINPNNPAAKFGENSHQLHGGQTLKEAIENRLQAHNITPRKNAVVALEYVVGLVGTPQEIQDAYTNYSAETFLKNHLADHFIGDKHGHENIVSVSLHFDETTPHAHIVVVPLIEKEVKWKNSKGSGTKKEVRLCAREFTGHKDQLRELQTDVHKFVNDYSRKLGVKVWRGTKKEEQAQQYTKATSQELGKLRTEFHTLMQQLERITNKANLTLEDVKAVERIKGLAETQSLKIGAKKDDFEKAQGDLGRIVEQHKKQQGKDEKWKKDKDFGMGF